MYIFIYYFALQHHDIKTEQPATFWLERSEEIHVSVLLKVKSMKVIVLNNYHSVIKTICLLVGTCVISHSLGEPFVSILVGKSPNFVRQVFASDYVSSGVLFLIL